MKQKMQTTAKTLLGALPLLFVLSGPAYADPVDWQNVPEGVQRTILENDGNRQPEGVDLRVEDGKTVYQATVIDAGGLRRIVRTDANGELLAEEEREPGHDVDWSTVPPAAKAAIINQSQHLKIEEVEAQQINGNTIYVAQLVRPDGSKLVISVSGAGQILGERSRSGNY